VAHGRVGLCRTGAELRLPVDKGSGEEACRAVLRRFDLDRRISQCREPKPLRA